MDNEDPKKSDGTARQKANRLAGLSSYAMGLVLLGIIAFGIFDDPSSVKKGFTALVLMGVGALVCFAIGYTTGRKK